MPARKVSTIDANDAMKSSHSWRLEVEDVAGDDAERQLEQRDRDAELDREHAREQHYRGEDCGELDWLHHDLHFVVD